MSEEEVVQSQLTVVLVEDLCAYVLSFRVKFFPEIVDCTQPNKLQLFHEIMVCCNVEEQVTHLIMKY